MVVTEKIEGTILLDGLIEGHHSGEAEVEAKLEQWVQFVATLGLKFNLDSNGSAFSVLPDNHAVACARLGSSPEDAIRQAIEQLVGVLPAKDRDGVFSTLRSAEFRKNEEVQSLYVVNPGGKVQVQSRSVEAKTVAPPRQVTVKERIKLGIFGLLIAVAMFGIAMLFPPVRQKFAEFIGSMKPVTVEAVVIRADAFTDFFTATPKEFVQGQRVLVIELKRGADFPKTPDAMEAAYQKADTLKKKLAIEAIAKGYLRVELVDTEGEVFASGEFRIRDLATKELIELRVPVAAGETKRRLERVEIRY